MYDGDGYLHDIRFDASVNASQKQEWMSWHHRYAEWLRDRPLRYKAAQRAARTGWPIIAAGAAAFVAFCSDMALNPGGGASFALMPAALIGGVVWLFACLPAEAGAQREFYLREELLERGFKSREPSVSTSVEG